MKKTCHFGIMQLPSSEKKQPDKAKSLTDQIKNNFNRSIAQLFHIAQSGKEPNCFKKT